MSSMKKMFQSEQRDLDNSKVSSEEVLSSMFDLTSAKRMNEFSKF